MPIKKLTEFLDQHKIKYVMISHSPAYTAQKIAAAAHISGKKLAKTVVFKVDDKMALAVLPASYTIDFNLFKKTCGSKKARLATEQEFGNSFPDCQVGAMPPFGNLYDMDVYVDETLAEDDQIAFNAGSHAELMQLAYQDFANLVKPKVAKFSLKQN